MVDNASQQRQAGEGLVQGQSLHELLGGIALRASTAGSAQLVTIEDAMRFALERVCRHTGWPVGHVYVPTPGSDRGLESARIWHLADPLTFEPFRKATEKTRLAPGEGIPGRVLTTSRPAWVNEISREIDCPRAKKAKEAGLTSYLAFPVLARQRARAVVEFFSWETIAVSEDLKAAMMSIGRELGRALEGTRDFSLAQQAAELYRSVIETSPDAIVVTDLNGVVLMSNKQAAAPYGFDDPERLLGLSAFEFIAPEDRERAMENARRTLEVGAVRAVEYTLLRKDGERVPVELSASVIRDPEGQPRAFIAVVRNVAQRKEWDRALRDSEQKFRTLTQMNAAATYVYKGGRLLYANSAAAKMTGYSVDELLAMDPWKLVHPDFFDSLRKLGEVSSTAPVSSSPRQVELKILTKTGEERWVEYTGALVQWEGGTAVLGTSFDVTEHKQAEDALRRSEERYRALFHDNPAMYFTVSASGIVRSVNQFGADQLGYSEEELVGRPVIDVFYKEDRLAVAQQLAACVGNLGQVAHWEFRKVTKDGRLIWVKESARATIGIDGEVLVLIVCEDVTERKRMEEELQKAREELEGKVEQQMQRGRAYGLTFRELTVLHLVAAGNSDRDIATNLGISPLTVSKHVANILSKMGASSRSEASARAVRESLLV